MTAVGRRRCARCTGRFTPELMAKAGSYCRKCESARVMAATSPEQRKKHQADYVLRHGRDKINADARAYRRRQQEFKELLVLTGNYTRTHR